MNKENFFVKWIWEFIILNLWKLLLFLLKISIILIFFAGTYNFALNENNTAIIVSAGFALFFILFFFGSNFEIVELLGVKFKLRELKESLEELCLLAKANFSFILENVQAQGRWGGLGVDTQFETYEKVDKVLRKLNVPENEIHEIQDKTWFKWIKIDYTRFISKHVNNKFNDFEDKLKQIKSFNNALLNAKNNTPYNLTAQEKTQQDFSNYVNSIPKKYFVNYKKYKTAKETLEITKTKEPSVIKTVIKDLLDLDTDLNIMFSDFEYYIENRKHPNLQRWKKLNRE